jgi:hypothetical protein
MDWIRENKPLAAILGVILVGSLALGYLLFDAWSSYSETKEGYLGLGSQVAALNGARLAPTQANLTAKQAMVDEYAKLVNTLGGALVFLQPKVEPINDIEFQEKLKSKISDVRKAVASKMQLPADFAFGFDEYNRTLPKSAAAAAELSGYLDAMDALVALFLNCGVQAVDSLERSQLPIETAASAPTQGNNAAGMQPPAPVASTILEKRNITVVLTLDQGPLQLLVSRITNPTDMPYFTSLRLMRIENQLQDGPLRADVRIPKIVALPGGGGGGAQQSKEEAPSDEIKPPPPAPVDSISVFGKELLKVRMEIDLIQFLNAAKVAAAQPPAGR